MLSLLCIKVGASWKNDVVWLSSQDGLTSFVTQAICCPCAGQTGKSGYNVHPASADCSFHLGAVPHSTDPAAPHQPSKIPIGFGAYLASHDSAQLGARISRPSGYLDKISMFSNFISHVF